MTNAVSASDVSQDVHAPNVVLLPDAMFFTRSAPVTAATTATEVGPQAELALEALSPFPAGQLFHGFQWTPGGDHALVFAAYRRRFPREQVEAWRGAELVIPTFAACFGLEVEPSTTVILSAEEGFTAIHWEQGAVPAAVLFRPVLPDASDADRNQVRDELVRAIGGSRKIVDVTEAPVADGAPRSGNDLVFRVGERVSRIPAVQAATLDIRDKGELATLRQSRARDLMLWRIFLGGLAAIALVAVGWGAVYGVGFWQRGRERKVAMQQPVVEQIMTAQNLATRINELSTKRLLPLEMISLVSGIKPATIQFMRTSTDGLYTLKIDAQTTSPGEVSTFRSAIGDLATVDHVEVRDQRTRDNLMTFTLVVTFKADALKPATPS